MNNVIDGRYNMSVCHGNDDFIYEAFNQKIVAALFQFFPKNDLRVEMKNRSISDYS